MFTSVLESQAVLQPPGLPVGEWLRCSGEPGAAGPAELRAVSQARWAAPFQAPPELTCSLCRPRQQAPPPQPSEG